MKLKLFTGAKADELQKEVNDFMKFLDVVKTDMSINHHGVIVIAVWYK